MALELRVLGAKLTPLPPFLHFKVQFLEHQTLLKAPKNCTFEEFTNKQVSCSGLSLAPAGLVFLGGLKKLAAAVGKDFPYFLRKHVELNKNPSLTS